jgi:hypothetical protein
VLGRINVVVAACQNGDSSGCKGGMMGGGVDAASQTGRYRKTGFAELARNLLRELQSGSRCIARADDRDHGLRQNDGVAAHGDQRRRIVDHLQARGISRFAKRDEINPELVRGRHFALGFCLAANLHCGVGSAPSG